MAGVMRPVFDEFRTILSSSTNMKIAICLSGLVRTYRQTYENFVGGILKPNEGHEIDVFISTWTIEHSNNSMERTRRIAWNGPDSPPFPEDPIDYNDLRDKYRPTTIVVEQPIIFPNPTWYTPIKGVNIQSLLSMWYKIQHCDLLRRNYEQMTGIRYDAVVRMRFDTIMPFPLPITNEFNLDVLTVPSMTQQRIHPDYEWCNDKFAVGNRTIMGVYSDWFIHIPHLINLGIPLQPEILLHAHLERGGVKWVGWGPEMDMIRFM